MFVAVVGHWSSSSNSIRS